MKKSLFFLLAFFTPVVISQAQPDNAYINRFEGIDLLEQASKYSKSFKQAVLHWEKKAAPNYAGSLPENVRKVAYLEKDWTFMPVDTLSNLSNSQVIDLPYVFKKPRDYHGGWYFLKFNLRKENRQQYFLCFDRVEMFSALYVNGRKMGHHFGAYTPFNYDITQALSDGENLLAIYVYDQWATIDGNKAYNQLGVERPWDLGILSGGIRQIPILEIRPQAHMEDIFVKTSTRNETMTLSAEINNLSEEEKELKIKFDVLKWPQGQRVNLDIPEQIFTAKSGHNNFELVIPWENPDLWSPENPALYVLRSRIDDGKEEDILDTRFGFREFWIEGQNFMLNGKPIRLRGESSYHANWWNKGAGVKNEINFHHEFFNLHKDYFDANAVRLHARIAPGDVPLAADEAGILIIDQSSIWSVMHSLYRNGGEWFLQNTKKEFEEWVRRNRNCPSVVIWDVENEMLRINPDNLFWVKLLPGFIKPYDDTRPFNFSGAGWFDEEQDMVHLHMQEHYTRIMKEWKAKSDKPLVMGEFWIGGRGEGRLPSSLEFQSLAAKYEEEARIYEEQMLEMRYLGVSSVMPFRISRLSFYQNQAGKEIFNRYLFQQPDKLITQTRPKAVTGRIKHGLQAETIFFWPRDDYFVEGKSINKELVVCNDSESEQEYFVQYHWAGESPFERKISIETAQQQKIPINLPSPVSDRYLVASLIKNNQVISSDTIYFHQIPAEKMNTPELAYPIRIYQPHSERLVQIFDQMKIKHRVSEEIPNSGSDEIWVIPPAASDRFLNRNSEKILQFLSSGGKIFCMNQTQFPGWAPVKLQFWSAIQTAPHTYAKMGWEGLNKDLFFTKKAPLIAAKHPVFDGIKGNINHWSDYDGRVADDTYARPSIVDKFEKGTWRVLAGGTRREHAALSEMKYGKGLILFSQFQILENFDNPQAKTLFLNMLKYLDANDNWDMNKKLKLTGTWSKNDVMNLTGISENSFQQATPGKDLMLATDGGNLDEVKHWANEGGTALVLSAQLSKKLEGINVSQSEDVIYGITKGSDHPLFYGVAAANFLNFKNSSVEGYFNSIPSNAEVLLHGFQADASDNNRRGPELSKSFTDAGPVAVKIPYENGEIILTTITPWKGNTAFEKELMNLFLANGGIYIEPETKENPVVNVLKTVPLTIDGDLNDWLNDMEDRLVSQFVHAQPILITAENTIAGSVEFDLDLSGIAYLLYDDHHLHLAGVVFGEEKNFESGVEKGKPKNWVMKFHLDEDLIAIHSEKRSLNVKLNENPLQDIPLQGGIMQSKNLTDAQGLQFTFIHKSGQIRSIENMSGETFELSIPLSVLQNSEDISYENVMIQLNGKESILQKPVNATIDNKNSWMDLKFEP